MAVTSVETAGGKTRRGAAVLLEVLRSEGVEYIFGNPGTTELPLIDALLEVPNVHYVLGLQEASVVAMADGYAQAARKPGFLNLHTAGGLGHGMGNLLNASVSQTPLVVTAGQQDSRHTISDPLLFGDLVQIARPAVKWAQEVAHADQLPVLLRRAFHDSTAAPTGPVFLSLPMDVMEEMSSVDIGEPSNINRQAVAGGLPELAQALTALRPGKVAIIAGDEVYASDAADEVAAVAECLGAPVYGSSWPSRIPFATAHPLWCGNLPTQATGIAEKLSGYDAIFALGGKSLITILYTEGPALPPSCAVYQMSSDVRDLGRTFWTPLSVVGDIRASLQALLPMLQKAAAPQRAAYAASGQKVAEARRAQRAQAVAEVLAHPADAVISPRVAAWETVRAIGPDIAIVDEAIATSSDVRLFLESAWSAQYSFLRGGALGWGMPAAVGASLGLGRDRVVSLVGDGAALYSPQALWTAAHEKLPVTFVVMNNREYNVLKNFMRQQNNYISAQEGTYPAMDIVDPQIDYQALARSMGVPSSRVTRAADIAPTLEAALATDGPTLVEIMIAAG
ncbi:acetolactate synthase large subunit [Acetobacter senegalensis DSM 18889]|uniref:Benzoylformate decarboxylase n=1 Tax=Acetobacter pasteurianus subsp. pasteurianus TaxID=481145 RepID=A0A1Y0XYC3_ACEPA|nr:thiamine pyrophosphate-dependent enzyme [Acetobacter pasteurianus]ARW47923.1 Benzoylformate decarboxylase [Acetobacter pasteurianus subsp. pasteurianus]NLG91558.1 thiamine pyrophosphate-binding protein [Acetobacter sp.]GBR56312.1 acetolactate synthase large subunit [Acetobacter senegalensis DSM 18889]